MPDRIEALRLFVRTARTGSFSRGGRDLGLSQPVASRTIAALEKDLGTALFTRTTRAVVLTDAGQEFLARVDPILADLDAAYQVFNGETALRGTLRIGMSSTFAMREIIPRLPDFLSAHPALQLELMTSDQRQDLVLEGVDVALRLGRLADSTATSRRLGQWQRALLAAPGYLERMGTPVTPNDLSRHQIISGPSSSAAGLTFRQGDRSVTVKVEHRIAATLNEAAIVAAVAGLGIVATGISGTFAEVQSGVLRPVLTEWSLEPVEVHAVYPAGKAAKPAARLLIDFLIADLNRRPSVDPDR